MTKTDKHCCANCHYYLDGAGCTYVYDRDRVMIRVFQPYKETNCKYCKESKK